MYTYDNFKENYDEVKQLIISRKDEAIVDRKDYEKARNEFVQEMQQKPYGPDFTDIVLNFVKTIERSNELVLAYIDPTDIKFLGSNLLEIAAVYGKTNQFSPNLYVNKFVIQFETKDDMELVDQDEEQFLFDSDEPESQEEFIEMLNQKLSEYRGEE